MVTVTDLRYAHGPNLQALETHVAKLISTGFTAPVGAPAQIAGTWVQAMGKAPPGEGGPIAISDVEGLSDALAGLASADHSHTIVSTDDGNALTVGSDGGAMYSPA